MVLSSDKGLRERVNANRKRLNDETFKYYAAPGASKEEAQATWAVGFLRRNKQDWEDSCETLAGDRHAVPYLWEKELAQLVEASDSSQARRDHAATMAAVLNHDC